MTAAARSTAAALILLFALVFALLAAVLVPAFLGWAENGRSIRADREKIAAVKTAQNSFVRVKYASDQWEMFGNSADAGFLDAATAEEAPAVARLHLETLLARHGGTWKGAEFAAGEARRGQVETVIVDLRATLPKAFLAPFLTELEGRPPYTFVSAFTATQGDADTVDLTLKGQMQRLGKVAP